MPRVVIVEPDQRRREIKEAQLRVAGYLVIGVGEEDLARAALAVSPYPLVIVGVDDFLPLPWRAAPGAGRK